jgi:hypothetical protein
LFNLIVLPVTSCPLITLLFRAASLAGKNGQIFLKTVKRARVVKCVGGAVGCIGDRHSSCL